MREGLWVNDLKTKRLLMRVFFFQLYGSINEYFSMT